MQLKDPKPYMMYAYIRWLDDSKAAPHVVIQNGEKTRFPPHLSANSLVTFRVTSESIRNLNIDDDGISFLARFSGKEFTVYAPLDCVVQVHSENGKVIIQTQQPDPQPQTREFRAVEQSVAPIRPAPSKPTLGVVEGGKSDGSKRAKLTLVPKTSPPPSDDPGDPECA
jgi:stringent starvation protein B